MFDLGSQNSLGFPLKAEADEIRKGGMRNFHMVIVACMIITAILACTFSSIPALLIAIAGAVANVVILKAQTDRQKSADAAA